MDPQAQTVFDKFQHPRAIICGVCATLSERSGVPAWVIRVAAVVLLAVHWLITGAAYLLAASWLKRSPYGTWRDFGANTGFVRNGPPPAPPSWDTSGLTDRFRRLDARLARMEAEAFHNEAGLRRAFNDLERHP